MSSNTMTQIGVLSRPRIVMRSFPDSFRAWCEQCCDVVLALAPDSAVTAMRIDFATLDDLLAANKLHVVELGAKSPLICGNSITHQCGVAFGGEMTAHNGK